MPSAQSALALAVMGAVLVAPAAASNNCANWDCAECSGSGMSDCTRCNDGYYLDADGWCWPDDSHNCGHLTPEEENDYYGKILVGTIIGVVIGVITTAVASLPVCCGVIKEKPLVPIAIAIGVVAGISMFIPMITGKVAIDGVVSDICEGDKCDCTEGDEQELKDALSALGIVVAYTYGFGFLCVVFGGVTLCLSCCMCCPCCGPLQQMKLQKQQEQQQGSSAVQGQVVGQPVAGNQCS